MNAVGLLLGHIGQSTNLFEPSKKNLATKDGRTFQTLLMDKQVVHAHNFPSEAIDNDFEDDFTSMLLHIFGSFFDIRQLEDLLAEAESEVEGLENILSIINSQLRAEEIQAIKDKLTNFMEANHELSNNATKAYFIENAWNDLLNSNAGFSKRNASFINIDEASGQINRHYPEQIYNQLQNIVAEGESVLANLQTARDVMKASPQILKLLEEWTALEQKYGQNHAVLDEKTTKEQRGWQQLIKLFKNRNELVMKQQYNRLAGVTSSDIAKWTTSLISQNEDVETGLVRQQPLQLSSAPLSKIEQYVIFVNQTQNSGSVDQQMIERFHSIIAKSNFLARHGGINQLSIALKPDNLGEMVVRLTQINGEMAVKLIVTSTATKKMLESNLHQLKSMFSPQQVVIEKQDLDMLKLQEEQEELFSDQQNEEKQEEEQKKQQQDDVGEFLTQFEQILNEKV